MTRSSIRASDAKWDRLLQAYRAMVEAGYRPAAPSDGFGHITVPLAELDLDAEAEQYAAVFIREEDGNRYWVGLPDFRANRAFIWTLEALRLMCSGSDGPGDPKLKLVPQLLRMAAAEYKREFK